MTSSQLLPRIFFIPARGRKQVKYDLGLAPDIDFLYPREGTETSVILAICSYLRISFIPARGRKPKDAVARKRINHDFLYPREGTETIDPSIICDTFLDFLYPREGTETLHSTLRA